MRVKLLLRHKINRLFSGTWKQGEEIGRIEGRMYNFFEIKNRIITYTEELVTYVQKMKEQSKILRNQFPNHFGVSRPLRFIDIQSWTQSVGSMFLLNY